jgi:SPP1 gp7 family putative phage head morphogenesis protein
VPGGDDEWGDDSDIGMLGEMPYSPQPKASEPSVEKAPPVEASRVFDDAFGKARRANTWHALNNRVVPIEKRCAGAVRRYFYEIERKLLSLAKDFKAEVTKDVADPDIDAIFSDEELYQTVARYLGQAVTVGYSTMGIGEVNIEDPGVNQYMGSRVQYMKNATDTAKDDLKRKLHELLVQAMEDKLTETERTAAIEKLIKEHFAGLKSHARTIARTEVHGAFADGRYQACEELQPTEIEWVSSRDALVRDSHANLDGQRVPFGERFANGCRYPLDPAGGAAEVCNCRCTFSTHF